MTGSIPVAAVDFSAGRVSVNCAVVSVLAVVTPNVGRTMASHNISNWSHIPANEIAL